MSNNKKWCMFEMVTKIDCSSYEAKFLIFARVIDMFARHSVLSSVSNTNDLTLTFNELKERLLADKDVKVVLGTFSDKQINEWISELSWMGYIERVSERTNNSVIKLTPEGFAAYKSQNLQSIAANLLAARESRRQANVAIWIAVVAILVTATFSTLGFFINNG